MFRSKRYSGSWRSIALFFAVVGLSLWLTACGSKMTVLEEREIDRLPVMVHLLTSLPGFGPNETVLVLVPATFGKIRQGRGLAEVLAVYQAGKREWQSRTELQPQQIRSLDYRFATADSVSQAGILLPSNLGKRIVVSDAINKTAWIRIANNGLSFSIEAAFGTDPLTVRKVLYKPSPDGLTLDLEKSSLLKVREQ